MQKPIENKTLEKLFLHARVKHIYIQKQYIEFSFKGNRDYYCGLNWTSDGNPIGFAGSQMDLFSDGTGWKYIEENSDNRYYTEKIVDNWYYYEMVF